MKCSHCQCSIPSSLAPAALFCPACGQTLLISKTRSQRDATTVDKETFAANWKHIIDLEQRGDNPAFVPTNVRGGPLSASLRRMRQSLRDSHPITKFLVEHPLLSAVILMAAGSGLGVASSLVLAAAASLMSLGSTIAFISALIVFLCAFGRAPELIGVSLLGLTLAGLVAILAGILAAVGTIIGIIGTVCLFAGGALAVAGFVSLLHQHRHELRDLGRSLRHTLTPRGRRKSATPLPLAQSPAPRQTIIVHRRKP